MSKNQEEAALLEMLQGPWVVKDDCGDLEIVLEERDQDSIGYCHIATCMQDNPEIARLIAAAPALLDACERLMAIHCPLAGNPSHERLDAFWEYEKTQGRGEADDQLFALAAIAKATESP